KITIAGILTVSLLASSLAFAELTMNEGKWEITVKTEMPGMPAQIPPMKHIQCITKKDAVPHPSEQNKDCKITNVKISGNTVSWAIQCQGKENSMSGSGKVTYKNDSFDGVVDMSANVPGQGSMKIHQKMNGKRLGACK
ncbi:MAG: DUF3617 family protein, partial [Nitrospirales bacterium]|nr:DUF3617 family protein [Nitrospirales bacterium]